MKWTVDVRTILHFPMIAATAIQAPSLDSLSSGQSLTGSSDILCTHSESPQRTILANTFPNLRFTITAAPNTVGSDSHPSYGIFFFFH